MRASLLILLELCAFYQISLNNKVERIQGKNYWVSYPDKANWFQAMRICAVKSLFLVDAITPQENTRILTMINRTLGTHNINAKTTDFWASGTNVGEESTKYYWMQLALDFNFTYWGSGQPKKIEANFACVAYRGNSGHYHWATDNCLLEHYYICRDTSDTPMRGFQRKQPWANLFKKHGKCKPKLHALETTKRKKMMV